MTTFSFPDPILTPLLESTSLVNERCWCHPVDKVRDVDQVAIISGEGSL